MSEMRFCTSILTFWPNPPPPKLATFLGGVEPKKKLTKIFLRLRHTYKKYILQKNDPDWSILAPRVSFISNSRVQEVATTN